MDTSPVANEPARRVRLDRRILVSNLVAGAVWLWPLAFASWPLLLMGAAYVGTASVFLGAVYAREVRTPTLETAAWITPWLVAAGLWVWLMIGIEFENTVSHYAVGLGVGLFVATICYLLWQAVALMLRQVWPGYGSLPARAHR
jgi:hypothetical protein